MVRPLRPCISACRLTLLLFGHTPLYILLPCMHLHLHLSIPSHLCQSLPESIIERRQPDFAISLSCSASIDCSTRITPSIGSCILSWFRTLLSVFHCSKPCHHGCTEERCVSQSHAFSAYVPRVSSLRYVFASCYELCLNLSIQQEFFAAL